MSDDAAALDRLLSCGLRISPSERAKLLQDDDVSSPRSSKRVSGEWQPVSPPVSTLTSPSAASSVQELVRRLEESNLRRLQAEQEVKALRERLHRATGDGTQPAVDGKLWCLDVFTREPESLLDVLIVKY